MYIVRLFSFKESGKSTCRGDDCLTKTEARRLSSEGRVSLRRPRFMIGSGYLSGRASSVDRRA